MDGQKRREGQGAGLGVPGEAKKGGKEREAKKGEKLKILPLPAESHWSQCT